MLSSLFKKFIISSIILVINSSRAPIIFPTESEVDIESFGECYTPHRERGLCIDLMKCTDLFNLLTKNPLLEEDRLYLTQSQCGQYNQNVLVCCPSRSVRPGGTINNTPIPPRPVTNPTRGPINRPGPGPIDQPTRSGGTLPTFPECGISAHDRIYGGNRTKIDEFPWMVLLQYTKPGNRKGFHCGGTLINNRYVLTASHCVNGKAIPTNWALTGVRLGEWDTSTDRDCEEDDCSDPVLDVPIERAISHEEYNPNSKGQYNDIALLRLSREVRYSDWIKPICLPSAYHLRNANFDGVSLDVAGWGKTESVSASNIKLKARVDGMNLEQCNQIYRKHNVILRSSQLCAGGERGIDSCRGDSGGPLIGLDSSSLPYYYQVGIVSFGPSPCGLEGWPGVYTKVGSYLDWIESHVES